MNDTYAVVNKPKQPLPPAADPAHSVVATPGFSRELLSSHHYDNDPSGAVAPVYSVVRPRAKPHSLPLSATPLYATPLSDTPSPTNHRLGEGLPSSLGNNGEYHLSPGDDEYEDFSSSSRDITGLDSPGGIGFNCRIQKPRGPRDPPAEWSRLER